MLRARVLVSFFLLVPSCALIDSFSGGDDDDGTSLPPAVGSFELNRQVDILFVIDDSGSMREEQENLASTFPQFTAALQQIAGGMPDLHIGVVSTNTGAIAGISSCDGNGDDGVLQAAPSVGGCSVPSDPFIIDLQEGDARVSNYPTTLAETFSCIAQLGIGGCGFESPLDAARRAVDPTRNPGFIRDDAILAVVFLTDEDDCSVLDRPGFFAAPNATVSDPLGPFASFRCFDFGVRCEPDDPRTFGDKAECEAREDSPYLESVSELAQFFRDLKGEGRFVATAIFGQPELSVEGLGFDASVIPNPSSGQLSGTPMLAPVCVSGAGEAVPAIRIQAFLDEFPTSVGSSICNQNFALQQIGAQIADSLSVACIPTDRSAPELCEGLRTTTAGDLAPVPQCVVPGEVGCFEIVDVEAACSGDAGLRYHPSPEDPLGATVSFDCFSGL